MINNYINHVVLVVDASGSMQSLSRDVVRVFDNQISYLAQRSKELDQETRVSVYLFNDTATCLVYDKDVLRLPSLASIYKAGGNTALVDATLKALEDLAKTPELYGDHAFLVYVLTDGEENRSRNSFLTLANKIKSLPDNWTLAAMVPSQVGMFEAKKFGFPANNIAIWSVTAAGLEQGGDVMKQATDNFMKSRATGVRSTRSLFSLDATALNARQVARSLDSVSALEYSVLPVTRDVVIKDFVESWTKKPYVPGSTYYQLTKAETVQPYKQVCIQDKKNGKVYSGAEARQMIGLPGTTVKVSPLNNTIYDIFLQSTSLNRKLVAGTKAILLK